MPTNIRDPRSVITAETLEFDKSLLGIPLARPGRRLVALLIDLAIIAFLTAITSGVTLFIWGFVGLFLLRMAWRSPSQRMGRITGTLFRGSTGCLGTLIVLITLGVGLVRVIDPELPDIGQEAGEVVVGALNPDDLGDLAAYRAFLEAGTPDEALEAGRAMAREMAGVGVREDDMEGLLSVAAILRSSVTGDSGEWVREVLESYDDGLEDPAVASANLMDLSGLSLAETAARYEEGLNDGRTAESDPEMTALQRRLQETVAGDSITTLREALGRESVRRADAQEELRAAQRTAEEADEGIVALLRDLLEQAGSVVGVWSIYFTLTLTLFRGFTVGKRAMGIRVIRLDGQPINWWAALERAGGYVAGLATGFLGFLQIFWDPNRQCVHDKIGGTVVVMAGGTADPAAAAGTWSDQAPAAVDPGRGD